MNEDDMIIITNMFIYGVHICTYTIGQSMPM